MDKLDTVSRRSFLISTTVIGGGFAIGFRPTPSEAAALDEPWAKAAPGSEFTPWLTIAPDNVVTVRCATSEIGNGVMTQAAMTVAEELDVDWSKINVEFAPPLRNHLENHVYTAEKTTLGYFAARSTSKGRMDLGLQVGASARERLKAAAAAHWKVPVAEIATSNSVLTHTPTGRTLKYGDVAARAAAIKLAKEPALKPQSDWRLLGRASPTKLNNSAIVNGTAVYGMDVRLPGMVYAALKQAPAHGGKIISYDDSVARKMPGVLAIVTVDPKETVGVKDVREKFPFSVKATVAQCGIAVIAEHYWQARKALDTVRIEWDDGEGAKWRSTAHVHEAAHELLNGDDLAVERNNGDIGEIDRQEKIMEASYLTPYCEHMLMEPLNGVALITSDRVEFWHPSQQSQQAYMIAADETGVPLDKVVFHQPYVGGGFGRRVFGDDARMVVAVAKKFPGRPVHVIWSREESLRQGRFRTLMAAKYRAGIDTKTGMPVGLHARYAHAGNGVGSKLISGLHDTPYAWNKNLKVEASGLPFNLIAGSYRGPIWNSFAFATETFIDECAHAVDMDPLEYRLKLLADYSDPGWVLCLREAAAKSGWGKSLPRGMGMGVAISNWGGGGKPENGTTMCNVATVEVTKSGALKVHQIDVAFDTGSIVNRDAVLTQIVGGTIFGLNMSLNEGLNIRRGRVVEGNYDDYPMLRMADTPKVNVHFGGLSGHERFSEIGEPPAGVIGPAVGNAIFAATGKRVRSTPFRLHDLSWA